MRKNLASSFILASALVSTMVVPAFADGDTFKSICQFPVRVVGSGVGSVVGVPLGATKDGAKGFKQGQEWVTGKVGNSDNTCCKVVGAVFGGPVGFAGGAAYGCFDGSVHGAKAGYKKPFSKDAFTFKEE